jgi:hypothetical protein
MSIIQTILNIKKYFEPNFYEGVSTSIIETLILDIENASTLTEIQEAIADATNIEKLHSLTYSELEELEDKIRITLVKSKYQNIIFDQVMETLKIIEGRKLNH